MPSTGEIIAYGAAALIASVTAFALIWRWRYFISVSVAGRSELRARLPSWSRWLVPQVSISPWFLKAQMVFGLLVATAVAVCFWVAFIAGVVEMTRAGRG